MFWERKIQLGEIAAGPKMGIPLKKIKGGVQFMDFDIDYKRLSV